MSRLRDILGRWKWRMDALRGHPDQTSDDEIRMIYRIAESSLFGFEIMCLEIGSWMGCSTIPLAHIAKLHRGKLCCVDSWLGSPDEDLGWIADQQDVFRAFWKRINQAELSDVVIPMRGKSKDILPLLFSRQFDIVYIDGGHSYADVSFDISQALRLLKPRGLIAGHDYDEAHPDVKKAVDEIFEKINHEGRLWWKETYG